MSEPVLEIPFSGGIDESTRVELVPPTSFAEIQNGRQDDRGGLSKRLGFEDVTRDRLSAVDRSNGYKLFQHKGIPMVIHRPAATNPLFVDSYSESLDINIQQSRVPECSYRLLDRPPPDRSFKATDTAYAGGFIATVSVPTTTIILSDVVTNTVVSVQTFGITATGATLATFSDRYIVAFIRNESSTAITAHILDTEAIATGWASLATVVATSEVDIPCSCSLSDRVAVAYGIASGTDRLVVKTYNASGVISTRSIPTSSGTPDHIDIDGSVAGTLWVAWDVSDAQKVIGIDADSLSGTLATVTTPMSSEALHVLYVCEGPSNTARVVAQQFQEDVSNVRIVEISTSSGAAVAGSTITVQNVGLMSRPWQRGGRFYMAACGGAQQPALGAEIYLANVQRSCIVVEFSDAVAWWYPHANIEPGLVSLSSTSKVVAIDSSKYVFPVQVVKAGGSTFASIIEGDSTPGNMLVELDFGSRDRWQTADFANYTYLGGALTSVFDGRRVVEAGFLVKPSAPVVTAGGGSDAFTGTWRYVAVYEDVDAAGNWSVSGISDPSDEIEVTNDTHIDVEVPPLTISRRDVLGTVRAALYRTADGGLPPYYRLGTVDNDPTTDLMVFTDDVEDAVLTTHAKLYAPNLPGAAGEPLDRRAPPGLVHVTSYNGMLVGARGESFFWSGQEVYGEAPWFSPVFEVPVTGGGDITALATQDGTLYIFKRDRVFSVTGESPADNGMSGGFGVPRLLASDVGCIESNSVVVTALGIFFRSARGLEILSRAQSVEWIGDQIQRTLAAFPVITSAVLDASANLVRFSLAESEADGVVSDEGVTLVFDLSLKVWQSSDVYQLIVPAQDPVNLPVQSAAMVTVGGANRYAWLGTNGMMHLEREDDDATAYLDGSNWIPQKAVTPWFATSGYQGTQLIDRLLLLAERFTGHDLTISIGYDYSTTWDETREFTAAEIAALSKQWLDAGLGNKRMCQAVRFMFEDATPSSGVVGTGRGAAWIVSTLDGERRSGAKRTTSGQR